mmetsp:Transcript_2717/g.10930  ORF Transcript_2717/g.10930 Transcript_2717/m.10930 type:complete len:557 (-) Transcript_2717:7874-9544(-)
MGHRLEQSGVHSVRLARLAGTEGGTGSRRGRRSRPRWPALRRCARRTRRRVIRGQGDTELPGRGGAGNAAGARARGVQQRSRVVGRQRAACAAGRAAGRGSRRVAAHGTHEGQRRPLNQSGHSDRRHFGCCYELVRGVCAGRGALPRAGRIRVTCAACLCVCAAQLSSLWRCRSCRVSHGHRACDFRRLPSAAAGRHADPGMAPGGQFRRRRGAPAGPVGFVSDGAAAASGGCRARAAVASARRRRLGGRPAGHRVARAAGRRVARGGRRALYRGGHCPGHAACSSRRRRRRREHRSECGAACHCRRGSRPLAASRHDALRRLCHPRRHASCHDQHRLRRVRTPHVGRHRARRGEDWHADRTDPRRGGSRPERDRCSKRRRAAQVAPALRHQQRGRAARLARRRAGPSDRGLCHHVGRGGPGWQQGADRPVHWVGRPRASVSALPEQRLGSARLHHQRRFQRAGCGRPGRAGAPADPGDFDCCHRHNLPGLGAHRRDGSQGPRRLRSRGRRGRNSGAPSCQPRASDCFRRSGSAGCERVRPRNAPRHRVRGHVRGD